MPKTTGHYTVGDFKRDQRYFVKIRQFDQSTYVIHGVYDGQYGKFLYFDDVDTGDTHPIEPKDILQVGDG